MPDRLNNHLRLIQYFVIPKTQNRKTRYLQSPGPLFVFLILNVL
ncbi:hypothetical protein CPter291_0547 [Collimonas pratensis]|uniref:Uncharacterized protein n=1 Tax=Collimonas pratensis TaxID=279113 RepID=A0A127PYY5_9BURK|nr:hypothetical protein CPter91_0616 [Collimonas pratensis]AMP12833.1 hypothetical protein CPter291_0547 [Collimonas pratensis]